MRDAMRLEEESTEDGRRKSIGGGGAAAAKGVERERCPLRPVNCNVTGYINSAGKSFALHCIE